MTISKLKIILKNMQDAYDRIDVDFKNRESFERKFLLSNLITSIELYLKEASIKEEYTQIEISGIERQLDFIASICNNGFITEKDLKLEGELLKRKEDLELSILDFETITKIDLPSDLLSKITSWYN